MAEEAHALLLVPHRHERLAAARRRCLELDWKIADVVLAPVAELPEDQVPR
ncbi:hypothetical protein ACH9DO_14310 [Kocuria sp. M1N1S27]|uniref:hypothetical protein n=1 Tax=Kocuria kalidii TaxID=3376283 RepID=UPI00378C71A5